MRQRSRAGIVVAVVVVVGLVVVLIVHKRTSTTSSSPTTTSAPGTTAATRTGTVDRWGGYIGGSGKRAAYPQRVPTVVPGTSNITSIDAGNSSSYALQCDGGPAKCKSDGIVWAWGDGKSGQLGNGASSNSLEKPVEVKFPSGVHIVSIGESRDNGYAIDQTGQGWAWGANAVGSLCLGSTKQDFATPVRVPGMTDATAVQGGQDHVVWLLADGTVESCGENAYGQLGDGGTVSTSGPVVVKGLADITEISCGNQSSAALNAAGQVYMWGRNTSGQVGVGSQDKRIEVPTLVKLPGTVREISAGGDLTDNGHTMALLSNGEVYAWGEDAAGQLANNGSAHQLSPVLVTLPNGVVFTHVAAGGATSVALDSHGNVWTWGNGLEGEIGNNSNTSSIRPIMVDHGVDLISATANNVLDNHGSI